MREQTVIADRQAEPCKEPHTKKQADLDNADGAIKQQAQREERTKKGQHIEDNEVTPLQLVKVTAPDYSMIAHFETAIDSKDKRSDPSRLSQPKSSTVHGPSASLLMEPSAAKLATSRVCRVPTDRTATIGVAGARGALDVVLPIVYEVQQITRG